MTLLYQTIQSLGLIKLLVNSGDEIYYIQKSGTSYSPSLHNPQSSKETSLCWYLCCHHRQVHIWYTKNLILFALTQCALWFFQTSARVYVTMFSNVTNYMKQLVLEANSWPASQFLLWNLKVHYYFYEQLSLNRTKLDKSSTHPTPYSFKIYFKIILPSMPMPLKWSFSFRFFD
jgi:hypothetical protein